MITLLNAPIPAVDPSALNGFLLAAAALFSTVNLILQQWYAYRGKVRSEKAAAAAKVSQEAVVVEAQAATTIAASNALALADHQREVGTKLDTIAKQTNGINQRLNTTVESQKAVIAKMDEQHKEDMK
jgi:hypothetical protein